MIFEFIGILCLMLFGWTVGRWFLIESLKKFLRDYGDMGQEAFDMKQAIRKFLVKRRFK